MLLTSACPTFFSAHQVKVHNRVQKGHELFTIVTFRSMMLECNIGILLELGRNSVLLM